MRHRRLVPLPFGLLCLLALALAPTLTGCAPAVGDACTVNGDCPNGSICDSTVPGGYCTIPDCRAEQCPGTSVCVTFREEESYCMQTCSSDEDCREGYTCREAAERPRFCYIAP